VITLHAMADGYEFTAQLWRWESNAAWHFISLPEEVTDEIDERWGGSTGGFGAVPVEVRIGRTRWQTSIFPDTGRGCYVLPVKKPVRTAEGLAEGSSALVRLTVRSAQQGVQPRAPTAASSRSTSSADE
jgi:hypothetical protein